MRILLAVDGSEASHEAVRSVRDRPWPPNSVVRVLCVAEPAYVPTPPAVDMAMGATAGGLEPVALQQINDQVLEHAQTVAESTAALLSSTTLEVEAVSSSGEPRATILEQAREFAPDLIVLGSHGRTGLKRWILGSVAESIVRHAPCSVQVSRPPRQPD